VRALSPLATVVAFVVVASPPASAAESTANAGLGGEGRYVHAFTSLAYGRGLRLNNPYRLQTDLGDEGEGGLSLTSGYVDLGLGAALGDPHGLQHGAVAHLSLATQGGTQEVLSLGYQALLPVGRSVLGSARFSVPLVLEPDFGGGLELGVGAAYYLTGGIGLNAELAGSLFLGAATWEHDPTLWPVVSLQLGVFADYEVLP
jgi:hypothetical protein